MFEYEQLSRVTSLDQIDIESLLRVSLPAMNAGTYIWPTNLITDEEKIEYYKNNLIRYFNARDAVFGFKRCIDNKDVSFNIGIIDPNGYWVYLHALVGNLNNSRGWIFDERITPQQTRFLMEAGFKGIIISSFGNSDALKHQLKKYETLDNIHVIENWKEDNEKGLLYTKIDFISSHNAD